MLGTSLSDPYAEFCLLLRRLPAVVGKVRTGNKCQSIRKSDIHMGNRHQTSRAHTGRVKVSVTKSITQIATGISKVTVHEGQDEEDLTLLSHPGYGQKCGTRYQSQT